MSVHAEQVGSTNLSLPPDTFIYSLAKSSSDSYAAISSDDTLTNFAAADLKLKNQTKDAHVGITCLAATSTGAGVATAGRDGLVKIWDERVGKATIEFKNTRQTGFSALTCNGQYIAAGTESEKEGLGDVSVLIWDMRKPSKPYREYRESHTDTITQLSFHPTQTSTFLSAATDGLVSLFDFSIADEDDALTQVLNHYSAVHCAGFIDSRGEEAYAISSDEQLSVYGLSKPTDAEDLALPMSVLGDIRPALGCAYVVDMVFGLDGNGIMSPFVAAGDTSTQSLTLTPLIRKDTAEGHKWDFDHTGSVLFKGAHGEEVVRDLCIDPKHQKVFTCGEDGQVRVWSMPQHSELHTAVEAMDVEQEGEEEEKKSSKKRRKDKKERLKDKEAKRFAPY